MSHLDQAVEELNAVVNTRGYAISCVTDTQRFADDATARMEAAVATGDLVEFGLARIQMAFWEWRAIVARHVVDWWDAHPNALTMPDLDSHAACNCRGWATKTPQSDRETVRSEINAATAGLERQCRALWDARWAARQEARDAA